MALRFMDGFDSYVTADIGKKWTTTSAATIHATNGRRSSGCLACPSGGNVQKTFDAQATWIVGFAFQHGGTPASARAMVQFFDSGTTQAELRLNIDGTLSITRNASGLTGGTSISALSAAAYYYIEWRITIANSIAADTCIVRVNGVQWINVAAGQDTQTTANATANTLSLAPGASFVGVWNYDDLYLCDGTGSAPYNTFLGDCRVDTLLPNAEGSTQQWTPSTGTTHYTLVDDAAPNTTDYVSSFTPTQRELFGMQDLSAMTGTIYGVQLGLAVSKPDAGGRNIQGVIRSGSSEALGTEIAVSSSQLYVLQMQTTDPATSAAWSETAVNSVQVGAEVV